MVFQAIQIFVSLLADVAFIWFFLLHALRSRVWRLRVWVNNGESAIGIIVQSLVVVTVLESVSRFVHAH